MADDDAVQRASEEMKGAVARGASKVTPALERLFDRAKTTVALLAAKSRGGSGDDVCRKSGTADGHLADLLALRGSERDGRLRAPCREEGSAARRHGRRDHLPRKVARRRPSRSLPRRAGAGPGMTSPFRFAAGRRRRRTEVCTRAADAKWCATDRVRRRSRRSCRSRPGTRSGSESARASVVSCS